MKRVVFISEIPVSYRIGWFDHLQKSESLDVRVLYLAGAQSDRPWEAPSTDSAWSRKIGGLSLPPTVEGFFARVSPTIGRELSREKPDFVVLPGWAHPACWQAARWCRRHDVPYGVLFENWKTQAKTRVPSRIADEIRRRVLDGAAIALPVGKRAARYAEGLCDIATAIVHANCCDVDQAQHATVDVQRAKTPTVLYLGRLMEHKGTKVVLEMAPHLSEEGVRVVVAGDGPMRPDVEAAASGGDLDFVGPLLGDDRFVAMAEAHLVLVPSRGEPWGVVVHESLACGTSVIASQEVGCCDDFIQPGVTGAEVVPEWQMFEATTRSWLHDLSKLDAEACRSVAETVTYDVAARELECALEPVLQ